MKKYLFMGLSLALCVAMAITGTLAYLQDSDSDVNVMSLGEVDIEQLQYERVVENGAWVSTGETDKYGYTPDKLQAFTQNKPLYPAVFTDGKIKWDDRNGGSHQQSWGQVGTSGSNQLFDDSVKNVVDHFTFVKNNGINGAYVRTWFAFEQGEIAADNFENVIMTNTNADHWSWETVATDVQIDGNEYYVMCATYLGPKSNPTGVLASGATTYPSLLQIYMKPEANNAEVQAIDGNDNGLYDVLVVSQAVQVDGFANAETALNAAFGAASAENAVKLFESANTIDGADANIDFTDAPKDAAAVNGTDKNAVLTAINNAKPGDTIKLTEDTTIAGYNANYKLVIDKDITLDLNGKTLTTESGWGGIDLKGGASIVNGTINHTGNTAAIKAFQVGKIENVVINVTETAGKVKGGIVVQEGAGCYVGSIKNVVINGATNGIETYRCGDRTDYAIGSMENVTINAIDTGISLSAPVGTVTNCTIKGAKLGINAYLYGPYSVAMELNNCVVEGANADIYAHDEVGKTNPGTMNLTYDGAMALDLNVVCEFEYEVSENVIVAVK